MKMNQLKNIVEHINKLFSSDYNLSSFDAVRGDDLLDMVVRVLQKFEVVDKELIETSAPLIILNILEAIKYAPEEEITPDEFRSGLVAASKEIIYPILTFLLQNEANIRKRFYFSKYVTKIEVPHSIFCDDLKLQNMYQVYEDTIETFWLKYSENKKEAVYAKETKELEDDIYQMRIELSNLEKRIDAQCKKAELSENLLQETWELLKQRKKFAKLSKQFEEDNALVQELIDTIRNYNRRDKISSLEELIEKSEYYTDAQQVYVMSLKEVNADLKIFEKVATEPSDDDLQQLEEYQENLKHTVNVLHKAKDQDDAVNAMQNQLRILLKKKSLLSKQILKIRLNNEQILNKIDELSQILGGEILRGQTFKKYVSDLKARCNIYKKNKIYLKSLENEINILNGTLKELYDLEPDLKCKTANSYNNNIPEEIKDLSLDDIRIKTFKLHKEHCVLLQTCCEEEKKYQKVKDVFSDNLIEFDRKKHEFNVETGNLMDYIDNLTQDIEKLESLLNLEQEDLQMQENEVEKIQENLIRYSQMFIDNAGDVSTEDILKYKLTEAQETLNNLRIQEVEKAKATLVLENEKTLIKGVITLIVDGKMQI